MFKKSRIAMLIAGALFAVQTGVASTYSEDAALLDQYSSFSDSQQLTVFNPDGSAYSLTPVDIEFAALEPMYASDGSRAQDVVVSSNDTREYVAMSEPIVIAVLEEDVSTRNPGKDFGTIEENHRLNVDHF